MKTLQLRLIAALLAAALGLVGVLGSVLWTMAQSPNPTSQPPIAIEEKAEAEGAEESATVETSAIDVMGILVTATVGTVQGQCATTNSVQVLANTTVYYCYTISHTGGTGEEELRLHNLRTSRGEIDRNLEFVLVPGPGPANTTNTIAQQLFLTDSTSIDVTNFITWTARPLDNEPVVTNFSQASVDIVQPAVSVNNYVGLDTTSCATTTNVRVTSGTNVAFCISLQNTGDITYTSHVINDALLSIVNATINYTLTPGQTLNIIPTNLRSLGIANGTLERANVTGPLVNTVSVTSRAENGLTATDTASSTVEIGTTTVRFTKLVTREPETCEGTSTVEVSPGTRVYYCVIIENTGASTLDQHRLTEQFLSIDVAFNYPLAPGETLRVTNDFLARNNLPIVFGPFELHPRFGVILDNTMSYQGESADGLTVNTTAGSRATFIPTPTVTPTQRPDPTSTSTPFPTNTPTETPTSTPVTPSPTPTETPVTPSPTPTLSYAISLLQTPTPRAQVAGVPDPAQQDPNQFPTVDPNLPPTVDPNQPQPVQDPVLATATQIAVDATATQIAVDVVVTQMAADATATQIVVEATAAQFAVDAAAATAQAQVTSPLPTPTVESAVADPALFDPLATPTEMAVATPDPLTPDALAPGADVTVLPPLVTAVVATETSAVVMLVVTNTPEGGAPLPEGQRPIVHPTPTPTPDFVLAAARTFDVAMTTVGWLWFLVGSLVFFVTAGIVAGLFFRQSDARRYDLPEPDYWLQEELPPDGTRPTTAGPAARRAEDEWPADLP